MIKRLFLLSGIATLCVILNHATGWGFTAMFWWTDCYRPVATPCFDQVGSISYYVLLIFQQLTVFSVPAFLFISGFFVTYAARGHTSGLDWKMAATRIRSLLVPYMIWSALILLADTLEGEVYPLQVYIKKLLLGRAVPAYFYVPLICQLYLLSPLIVRFAKARSGLTLAASALLQFGTIGLRYLSGYGVDSPFLDTMIQITPNWIFFRWVFFFSFGLVASLHISQFRQRLSQFKLPILAIAVLLGFLAILEPQAPLSVTGYDWGRSLASVSAQLYALAAIMSFLAFDKVNLPSSETVYQLGKNSYGIYLLHPKLLEVLARIARRIVPEILGYQVVFSLLLAVIGGMLPFLLMSVVSRSPARKTYRYLFG
jgi:surface polysaccharide O-acyltransferase-like enzyme